MPGLGPVAFPPSCVEDPMRKRHIGALGRGIDSILAIERGKRICAGIDTKKSFEGGDAQKWGLEIENLKEDMKKKAQKLFGNIRNLSRNVKAGSQTTDSLPGNQMFPNASHFKITESVFATGLVNVTYQGLPQSAVNGMRGQQ